VRGTSFEFDGENLTVGSGLVHVTGGDNTGVYVGAGHRVVSDTWTGTTATAAELVKQDLAPAPPAGTTIIQESTVIIPPQSGPTSTDSGFGFEWD
jgi:hypothetical protein